MYWLQFFYLILMMADTFHISNSLQFSLLSFNSTNQSSIEDLVLVGKRNGKAFYTNPNKLGLTWIETLDYCHEMGMFAASIESLSEHMIVRNYLAKVPHRFFWLGGMDLFHEGHWTWLRQGKSFNFTRWAPGFPTKIENLTVCIYLMEIMRGWMYHAVTVN